MPEEEREEYRGIAIEAFFSGPLPPPSLFAKYDQVLPGAAERILALTEAEQTHRHGWEDRALMGEIAYGRLGLWLGAGALVGCLAATVITAWFGQTTVAIAIAAFGVAGLVGAFIKGREFRLNKSQQGAESSDSGRTTKK